MKFLMTEHLINAIKVSNTITDMYIEKCIRHIPDKCRFSVFDGTFYSYQEAYEQIQRQHAQIGIQKERMDKTELYEGA